MITKEVKIIDTGIFSELAFTFQFRKYQNLILQCVESKKAKDNKFHIVAPPGSGKTIVGLELIRRFNHPAVIFSPTSTIQLQWKEKVALFIPQGKHMRLNTIVSTDPDTLRPINTFTYQLISSPAENIDFIEKSACDAWEDDLVGKNVTATLIEAKKRILLLRKNNPESYKTELARYYKKIKDQYLRDPQFDGLRFLHPNARKLINSLVSSGVKIVVMDESHHLLDYWAVVIKELLKRIDNPILIGLTATPPVSADEEEIANYISIMGEIDFEIPTPAVVKEGNLAPYQDLVYFCNPTTKEKEFIDTLEKRFRDLVSGIGRQDRFFTWIKDRLLTRKTDDDTVQDWTAFFNTHSFLAIAGVKYLEQVRQIDIPGDVVIIEEMKQEMTIDDWVVLLTDYALNCLEVSDNQEDHQEYAEIQAVLRSFGFILTEEGMRQFRSPADKILALSESKMDAALTILKTEMGSMRDSLRVVVITDFEKQSATDMRLLKGILDEESGGAVRVFRAIENDPHTDRLDPILLTGTTVLIDKDRLKSILEGMNAWKKESGLRFSFSTKPTPYPSIVELIGSGPDWKSNTYVRMVTGLFERGIVKCLVGTRGILGEGWDSLSLNTLIDLTEATTSMTVNQLRGRSIRLDPKVPLKVANNWDVVCVDQSFEKGDQDFLRFITKHKMFYGLASKKRIVKGFYHVDEQLAFTYQSKGFRKIMFYLINTRMLAKACDRERIYKDWEIGNPYSNFEFSATKLDAGDLKFKTAYSLRDSLAAIFNQILLSIGTFALWYFFIFQDALDWSFRSKPVFFFLSLLFIAGVGFYAGKNIVKYIRKAYIEIPVDSFLLDIGKALAKSLRETGKIASSQSIDNVRLAKDSSGYYDIYLDYATKEDAATFSTALSEVMAPVLNQRYLVSRSIDDIRLGFYSPLWWTLRKIFRIFRQEKVAYHPVPTVLSVRKDLAENFSQNWNEYVGGSDLIYTRSQEGTRVLLQLRKYNFRLIKRTTYEIWK